MNITRVDTVRIAKTSWDGDQVRCCSNCRTTVCVHPSLGVCTPESNLTRPNYQVRKKCRQIAVAWQQNQLHRMHRNWNRQNAKCNKMRTWRAVNRTSVLKGQNACRVREMRTCWQVWGRADKVGVWPRVQEDRDLELGPSPGVRRGSGRRIGHTRRDPLTHWRVWSFTGHVERTCPASPQYRHRWWSRWRCRSDPESLVLPTCMGSGSGASVARGVLCCGHRISPRTGRGPGGDGRRVGRPIGCPRTGWARPARPGKWVGCRCSARPGDGWTGHWSTPHGVPSLPNLRRRLGSGTRWRNLTRGAVLAESGIAGGLWTLDVDARTGTETKNSLGANGLRCLGRLGANTEVATVQTTKHNWTQWGFILGETGCA